VPLSPSETWLRSLSETAREVMITAVAGGISTEEVCTKATIEDRMLPSLRDQLQPALIELMNHKPPLFARTGPGPAYVLTHEGAQVAHLLVAPSGPGSDDEIAAITHGPRRLHRGENNRRMAEHASEVGGEFVVEQHQRCTSCTHINSRFIRRGGTLLCQDCFWKGDRLSGAAYR